LRRLIILVVAAAATSVFVVGAAVAGSRTVSDGTAAAPTVDTGSAIVQLNGDGLATYAKTKPAPGKKIDFSSAQVKSYRAQLSAIRNDFKQWLQKNAPAANIVGQFDIGMNAVAVRLNGVSLATIESAPMVRTAAYESLYRPQATDPDLTMINAFAAWGSGGAANAGRGVKVGIVDTGIDQTHPDLAGRTVLCAGTTLITSTVSTANGCTDDNDHGSHVSGTIAAIANNGIGVAGVAFDARLSHCKALFGPLGQGSTAGVANCITYLSTHGAKIISMSLGGGNSTTLRNAVTAASNRGTLLIAAAGNDGDATLEYPAAYPEVVSVAANDRTGARASFSNANSDVEVSAPGVAILSTVRGGGYASFSGTSMATPHAAGLAAEIWSHNPTFTAAQVRSRLDSAVDDLGPAGRDTSFGFGRVNLQKALP
jgi:thermitase